MGSCNPWISLNMFSLVGIGGDKRMAISFERWSPCTTNTRLQVKREHVGPCAPTNLKQVKTSGPCVGDLRTYRDLC